MRVCVCARQAPTSNNPLKTACTSRVVDAPVRPAPTEASDPVDAHQRSKAPNGGMAPGTANWSASALRRAVRFGSMGAAGARHRSLLVTVVAQPALIPRPRRGVSPSIPPRTLAAGARRRRIAAPGLCRAEEGCQARRRDPPSLRQVQRVVDLVPRVDGERRVPQARASREDGQRRAVVWREGQRELQRCLGEVGWLCGCGSTLPHHRIASCSDAWAPGRRCGGDRRTPPLLKIRRRGERGCGVLARLDETSRLHLGLRRMSWPL